uniref:POP4 domain-containing protein n=1 Tax=Syphacia muris TaxID=451379 RepID=A0A0N5AL46_9BILA
MTKLGHTVEERCKSSHEKKYDRKLGIGRRRRRRRQRKKRKLGTNFELIGRKEAETRSEHHRVYFGEVRICVKDDKVHTLAWNSLYPGIQAGYIAALISVSKIQSCIAINFISVSFIVAKRVVPGAEEEDEGRSFFDVAAAAAARAARADAADLQPSSNILKMASGVTKLNSAKCKREYLKYRCEEEYRNRKYVTENIVTGSELGVSVSLEKCFIVISANEKNLGRI